jgi:hypothetical protein
MEKARNTVQITLDYKGISFVILVLVLIRWLYPEQPTIVFTNHGGNTYNTYNLSSDSGKKLPSFNEGAKVDRNETKEDDDEEGTLCFGANCKKKKKEDEIQGTGEIEPVEPSLVKITREEDSGISEDRLGTEGQGARIDSETTDDEKVTEEAAVNYPVVTTPENDTAVSEDDLIPEVIDPNDGKQRAKVIVNFNIKK